MSVQKRTWRGPDGKQRKAWRVQYDDGSGRKSRTFTRKEDADTFDAEVIRRRRLGTLAQLDAGTETLDVYVRETWTPTYGVGLAPKTRETYADLYRSHLAEPLGATPLRDFTPELIGRWQAQKLAVGAGPVAVRRALELLGSILQRAAEAQRIPANPARLVRKAKLPQRNEIRPLAPVTVEALRTFLLNPPPIEVRASRSGQRHRKAHSVARRADPRSAMLVALMAYAGLRPGEALALSWGDVREKTLLIERAVSLGQIKTTKTGSNRTVRLLGPLAADLREWRLKSGRPADGALVIPGEDGQPWTREAYSSWVNRVWRRAINAVGLERARPYDLRHSFASLLIHEGRNVIYVARQLGHGAQLTLGTYGHVMDELEESPNLDAETAIQHARGMPPHHQRTIGAIATGA